MTRDEESNFIGRSGFGCITRRTRFGARRPLFKAKICFSRVPTADQHVSLISIFNVGGKRQSVTNCRTTEENAKYTSPGNLMAGDVKENFHVLRP